MSMLNRLRLWLRSLVYGGRIDREMREEMDSHLARAAETWQARGLTPAEARLAARREFGHLASWQEEARAVRGGRGLGSLVADLRFGARYFGHRPMSALTMVIVLALGLGFNTALFVFISSFLSGPVPGLTGQPSLVRIRGIDRATFRGRAIGREFSYPEYREYAERRDLFTAVAAWTSSDVVLDAGSQDEDPRSGAASYVTSGFFPVLGIAPALGTGLPVDARDDDAAVPLVAVISDVVWTRLFARSPDVVGRSIKVNGVAVTIAGVAPRRFNGVRTGGSQMRVWLPLSARAQVQRTTPSLLADHDAAVFGLVARLAPDVDVDQASAAAQAIAFGAARRMTRPVPDGSRSTDIAPLLADNYFPPSGEEPNSILPIAPLLFPFLILLVTCTNVSALMAGLAIARRREIAVRLALGASRRRLVRQLVTESVLVAVAAGGVGLVLVWMLFDVFETSMPDLQIVVGWRGGLFTFGLAVAAGVIFGLSPAVHATRLAVSPALKDTAGAMVAAGSRLQAMLVVAQIALTQPLLLSMGAAMLEVTEEYGRFRSPPFAEHILDVRFNINPRYGTLDADREVRLERVRTALAEVPGVVAVIPQEQSDDDFEIAVHEADRVDAAAETHLEVRAHAAPPGYFALMDIPIVRGRGFEAADTADRAAIVISADLARRLWGATDPIGRRFITTPSPRRAGTLHVIGVAEEAKAGGPGGRGDAPGIYVPTIRTTSHFLIRTQGPAESMLPAIRSAAQREAPTLPPVSSRSLASITAEQQATMRNVAATIGGGGVIALFLSAIGLYAVVSFAVGQRAREIGIRTALGADRQRVVGLFVLRSMRLSLIGLTLGLALSVLVLKLMAVSLGGNTSPATIVVAATVVVVVTVVALLASWIPARRAARVDPLVALRTE